MKAPENHVVDADLAVVDDMILILSRRAQNLIEIQIKLEGFDFQTNNYEMVPSVSPYQMSISSVVPDANIIGNVRSNRATFRFSWNFVKDFGAHQLLQLQHPENE